MMQINEEMLKTFREVHEQLAKPEVNIEDVKEKITLVVFGMLKQLVSKSSRIKQQTGTFITEEGYRRISKKIKNQINNRIM